MKTALDWIRALVILAAVWGLAIIGAQGDRFAWNVFVFLQWFGFVIMFLAFLIKAADDKTTLPSRTLPAWFSMWSDVAMAATVAGYGHFFYATLIIVTMFLEMYVFTNKKDSGELA